MLDYSRFSRHLLLTAGDDGTVHLWDTTGRNPKVCSCVSLIVSSVIVYKISCTVIDFQNNVFILTI